MSTKRIAPWPDYAGNVIREGDTIVHPDGTRGVVEFDDSYIHRTGKWRVRYSGDPAEAHSALSLQIGERGMAVVTSEPPPQPAVLVPADELAALREDRERLEWMVADGAAVGERGDGGGFSCHYGDSCDVAYGDTARDTIDSARGVK